MARKPRKGSNVVPLPSKVPEAIKVWMDRVGAEQLNHRRYMVKQYIDKAVAGGGSYYIERSVLSVAKDGNVRYVGEDAHKPTEKEMEGIVAAVGSMEFPKSAHTTIANADAFKRERGVTDENWFTIVAAKDRKQVIMCQHRNVEATGDKSYYPWTRFDDGVWRCMEPDAALPFWKPLVDRQLGKIMIHEGSKAARYVDWMVNDDSDEAKAARGKHPWYSTLRFYEHWGINGGAMAPHRADYDELRSVKAKEVIYCCDRDRPGENALQVVSRNYFEPLTGVRYDSRFPHTWDMADQLPDSFYKDGYYIGPELETLMSPATWATVAVKMKNLKGKDEVKYELRRAFMDEWFHTVEPECYINARHPTVVHWGEKSFNNLVSPFSDVKKDIHRMLWSDNGGKAHTITYDPTRSNAIGLVSPNYFGFNTFTPTLIKAKDGDATMFYHYMEQAFPNDADRLVLLRWFATLSERLDIRMHFGLLFLSNAQGVGKSTVGTLLGNLVGEHNTSRPSESQIVDNKFNDWMGNCRLIVADEIYAGHNFTAYHRLKSLITEEIIYINPKHIRPYKLKNWSHIVANSNSNVALKIPSNDRRWFIPRVTEQDIPEEFWRRFYSWLRYKDGYPVIKSEMQNILRSNQPFETGQHAPMSEKKQEVIEQSLSHDQRMAADILDRLKDGYPDCYIFVTDEALNDYVNKERPHGVRNFNDGDMSQYRRMAEERGWYASPNRFFIETNKSRRHIISNKIDVLMTMIDSKMSLTQMRQQYGDLLKVYLKYEDFPWIKRGG